MSEEMHAFDVTLATVAGPCVAWEIEPPRLLSLDCECILEFAPILNANHRLLHLRLRAVYLSRGRAGQRVSSLLLPQLPSFPNVQFK
jgi:hypothetical protein